MNIDVKLVCIKRTFLKHSRTFNNSCEKEGIHEYLSPTRSLSSNRYRPLTDSEFSFYVCTYVHTLC